MGKIKKFVLGITCSALIMSIAVPAFAYSPITGWMTDGTYTGYPYLSWTESGGLWGSVAAMNRSTSQLVDQTSKSGVNNLYVRTPSSKLYYEGAYKGYYDYRHQ